MVYLNCPYCDKVHESGEKTEHNILSVTNDRIEVRCQECMRVRTGEIKWDHKMNEREQLEKEREEITMALSKQVAEMIDNASRDIISTIEFEEPDPIAEYKWFVVRKLKKQDRTRKTDQFLVVNHNGTILGMIQWARGFRQYAFITHTLGPIDFSRSCLNDISDFIENLMEERKNG